MLDTSPNATVERLSQPADSGCGRYWIVVQTHPQAEHWANTNLQRRGYRTYLPLLAVQRRDQAPHHARRITHIPLFTGYLFVQLNDANPWTPVRYAPGVTALLMMGGKPDRLRDGLIEALQAGDESRRSVAPPTAVWAPGTPCRLARGPFEGHDAVVLEVASTGKLVLVAVPMFGAIRSIPAPLEWLEVRT